VTTSTRTTSTSRRTGQGTASAAFSAPPSVTATVCLAGEVRAVHGCTRPVGTTPGFLSVVLGPLLTQCHDRVATVAALAVWREAERLAGVLPEVLWAAVAPDEQGLFTATGAARMTVAVTLTGSQPSAVRARSGERAADGHPHVQVGIAGINVLVLDRTALTLAVRTWHRALAGVDAAFPLHDTTR